MQKSIKKEETRTIVCTEHREVGGVVFRDQETAKKRNVRRGGSEKDNLNAHRSTRGGTEQNKSMLVRSGGGGGGGGSSKKNLQARIYERR